MKMKKNYFIIHGSFASPFSNWFRWLYNEIENRNDSCYCPDFPSGVGGEGQNYTNWEQLLKYYHSIGLINENTTIIGHSIAPSFVSKFLVNNKIKVKKLIFVCGFNNYLGLSEDYDEVNKTMYLDNIEEVKKYADEIVCFYSDNDKYVPYAKEKEFADAVATKQIVLKGAGHINAESGYTEFKEILKYL